MSRTVAPADAALRIEAQAQRHKTVLLYRNAGLALWVNLINASLLGCVNLTFKAPAEATVSWLGLLVAVALARRVLAHRFFAAPPVENDLAKWRLRYVGATAVLAAAWAGGSILFIWNSPADARLMTGLVLCGMVAGAVPILAPVPAAFRTFALLIALPTAVVLLLQANPPFQWALACVTVVFLAAMLTCANFMHRALDASIRLGLEKADLLERLASARGAAEAAVEASSLSLWELDVKAGRVYLDEHWHKIAGSAGQRAVSVFRLARAVHPEDRKRIGRAAMDAIKGPAAGFREDFRLRNAAGQWQWITCRGKVVERGADGTALRALGSATDISHRKAAESALAFSEKRYRTMFENAPIGIALTSFDGAILAANETMTRMFGYARKENGVNSRELYADPSKRDEWLSIFRQRGSVHGFETEFRRRDGSLFFGSLTVNRLDLDRGGILLVMIEDITERRQWRERMVHEAHHDSLTGLPNRRLLLDRVEQAMKEARHRGALAAVLFLDLDNFKQINDSLGHNVGDQLLKEVAARLKALVRRSDLVSRQGGDEFVVVLAELEQAQDAAMVATKILQALQDPVRIGERSIAVRTSIGISLYPDHEGRDAAALLRKADEAMYAAKQNGGSRYRYHDQTAEGLRA
jgi:diguanylate cyclase (GGDEF)-like protein/PAS domain S-box-containing protein